ncbi:hypothetical protein [Sanguibacter antarcticus]|uniref:Uncharacterized protein n=1 Tax=Sanguibacter antarcticus TaxID=372484 RepID=A0A2A9E7N0_9MICO|nr:hypothetical protein [Sanguibacter antarcticus]PFG34170.1 hypothetical protein ATL42_2074 [Sanguibacter antarcticus]
MTAPHLVDPADLLGDVLAKASADLMCHAGALLGGVGLELLDLPGQPRDLLGEQVGSVSRVIGLAR